MFCWAPSSAEFPNSAALSISIYNAIKPAAVSRIANPDTHCGRISNSPELRYYRKKECAIPKNEVFSSIAPLDMEFKNRYYMMRWT